LSLCQVCLRIYS